MKTVILPYIGQKVVIVEQGEPNYPEMPRHCEILEGTFYIRSEDEPYLWESFNEFIRTRFDIDE